MRRRRPDSDSAASSFSLQSPQCSARHFLVIVFLKDIRGTTVAFVFLPFPSCFMAGCGSVCSLFPRRERPHFRAPLLSYLLIFLDVNDVPSPPLTCFSSFTDCEAPSFRSPELFRECEWIQDLPRSSFNFRGVPSAPIFPISPFSLARIS